MAKLAALPEATIISGFKGCIDYYVWMGIPCVRKWPRSPGKKRAPAVEAQWSDFGYASQEWNQLSGAVQQAYRELAMASGLDGRDLQIRSYLTGLYRYETP